MFFYKKNLFFKTFFSQINEEKCCCLIFLHDSIKRCLHFSDHWSDIHFRGGSNFGIIQWVQQLCGQLVICRASLDDYRGSYRLPCIFLRMLRCGKGKPLHDHHGKKQS